LQPKNQVWPGLYFALIDGMDFACVSGMGKNNLSGRPNIRSAVGIDPPKLFSKDLVKSGPHFPSGAQ
jgi:hypothetical protein